MRRGLGKAGLYCDTVPSQATIRPGGAAGAGVGTQGRRRWARGARKRACMGARAGAAGSWARGHEAQWACRGAEQAAAGGRGARAGFGLCTRCTRPVFGSVRLSIFPESPNEHCSL